MPGIPGIPCMPGIASHCVSKAFIASISGCCSAAMVLASVCSSALVDRSGTSAASSRACSWWGIIMWANMTSAELCSAACAAVVVADVALCTSGCVPVLQELRAAAARAVAAAARAATRTDFVVMQPA